MEEMDLAPVLEHSQGRPRTVRVEEATALCFSGTVIQKDFSL